MHREFLALQSQIQRFVDSPDDGFGKLASRIFAFQFAQNAPYRSFCETMNTGPQINSWREIPPVPAAAFKSELPLSCLPTEDCERVFLTSGTTSEVRGRHFLADTDLYLSAVQHGWDHAGLPRDLRPLFLSRSPEATPDSSLACMFGSFAHAHEESRWLLREHGRIDLAALTSSLEQERPAPVLLFTTALALRHLFREPSCPRLPADSWVFQTGGYKGVSETYRPSELCRNIERHLGIPEAQVINEYGMTELSSQAYSFGVGHPHNTPPWLKVRSIHPESNQPNPCGQVGHLVFCDLANLNSVLAIRTEDLGIVIDDHTFLLAGRDPSALPRGCSRASDAHLQGS